jgi:hypothetical protein
MVYKIIVTSTLWKRQKASKRETPDHQPIYGNLQGVAHRLALSAECFPVRVLNALVGLLGFSFIADPDQASGIGFCLYIVRHGD